MESHNQRPHESHTYIQRSEQILWSTVVHHTLNTSKPAIVLCMAGEVSVLSVIFTVWTGYLLEDVVLFGVHTRWCLFKWPLSMFGVKAWSIKIVTYSCWSSRGPAFEDKNGHNSVERLCIFYELWFQLQASQENTHTSPNLLFCRAAVSRECVA